MNKIFGSWTWVIVLAAVAIMFWLFEKWPRATAAVIAVLLILTWLFKPEWLTYVSRCAKT